MKYKNIHNYLVRYYGIQNTFLGVAELERKYLCCKISIKHVLQLTITTIYT